MAEGTTRFDYDVIVVGFGMAGVCASIAAAESGARVLVVDRALGGGASALSGGVVYAGGGTSYQKAAGYDETPDNMFNYLRLEVNGVIDDETLKRFCDTSVDRLAWLERHGARFAGPLCDYKTSYPTDRHYLYFSGSEKAHPFCLHAKPAPRGGHRQVAKGMSSGGRVLWTSLRDSALRLGVTFMPRTRVDELVMVDGVVRGIRCRTWIDDGSPAIERHRRAADAGAKLTNWVPPLGHRLNRIADRLWQRSAEERTFSSPNVILSAGGFIFNRDMVRRYAPDHELVNPLGTEGDDGKGIELGVSAGGGATDHLERVTAWRFSISARGHARRHHGGRQRRTHRKRGHLQCGARRDNDPSIRWQRVPHRRFSDLETRESSAVNTDASLSKGANSSRIHHRPPSGAHVAEVGREARRLRYGPAEKNRGSLQPSNSDRRRRSRA